MNKYIGGLCIILVIFVQTVGLAQRFPELLKDKALIQDIKEAIDKTYNYEFDEAQKLINGLEKRMGDHPGGALLGAFLTTWKYQPIQEGTTIYTQYERQLQDVLSKSELLLEETDRKEEADFFMMAAYAYLAELYSSNDENLMALSAAKSCYVYVKNGFELVNKYPEYYFTSGIYHYYREKYPEENPYFKPFVWIFPSGSKEKGIQLLKEGSEKALFTQNECYYYLFHIYLRYEGKPRISFQYVDHLIKKYPGNLIYNAFYVENLYRLDKLDSSRIYIDRLLVSDKPFYKFLGYTFDGIYQEKYRMDIVNAKKSYLKAEKILKSQVSLVPHFISYLYAGLGRVSAMGKNMSQSSHYFDLAKKYAEYNTVRNMINNERYEVGLN